MSAPAPSPSFPVHVVVPVIRRENFLRDIFAVHTCHESQVQARDGGGERHGISAVGPFREVNDKNLLKLKSQPAPGRDGDGQLGLRPTPRVEFSTSLGPPLSLPAPESLTCR